MSVAHKVLSIIFITLFSVSCISSVDRDNKVSSEEIINPTNKVILSSDIEWEKLNPARGDKSPQAGTIWGDRKGNVPTGFLAKFVDGFSSPPHIHNVTYRAVVIKGLVHNDDPEAENMWMTPGSFWTQPLGESHITSAQGSENIALVEIDQGPYLVKPVSESFDNGERAINIDASNVVWLDHEKTNWVKGSSKAEISFLLDQQRKDGLKSLFIKLPQGYKGTILSEGSVFHAVIIKGEAQYTLPQTDALKSLDVGSYFGSSDQARHSIVNNNIEDILIYVRTNGVCAIE